MRKQIGASTRAKCACCGKPYGSRRTRSEEVVYNEGEAAPEYRGNLIVVRTRTLELGCSFERVPTRNLVDDFRKVGPSRIKITRELWDGVSWWRPYEPFCTLRCALAYARRAYRKATGK